MSNKFDDNDDFQDEIPTAKRYIIACRFCGGYYPHKVEFGVLGAIPHSANCGLACLGGGVGVSALEFHDNRCKKCYKIK